MPRKTPFSGKQKKQQLQGKKLRKQAGPKYLQDSDDDGSPAQSPSISQEQSGAGVDVSASKTDAGGTKNTPEVQKINLQPQKGEARSLDANSFRLHFFKEDVQAINKRKKEARKPIKPVPKEYREWKLEDAYPPNTKLDFPKRPPWNYSLSREELERREQEYFKDYVWDILDQPRVQDLSFFELNLQTWRQLWRVLEMSDILLIIADIRYSALHVPPKLLDYVMKDLHKQAIILLNKVDFVSPNLVYAWKEYLETKFPGVHIVFFTSFPAEESHESTEDPSAVLHKTPFRSRLMPVGPQDLCQTVKAIVKDHVDLSSWEEKLRESSLLNGENSEIDPLQDSEDDELNDDVPASSTTCFKDGKVTIGCIGYPNAGKSSVLNALVGRKVVSVSKNPGHTKHFQTIFLTPTVRLCDCPGLVFPSMVPKSLQVIAGIFPVAQVKEPYSVVGYLAKRVNLPKLLHIYPPQSSPPGKHGGEYSWSPYDICEAWAVKSGYMTSKAGRPDMFRAANKILRLAVEGQLCLCFFPPRFLEQADNMDIEGRVQALSVTSQAKHRTAAVNGSDQGSGNEGDADSDEEEESEIDSLQDEEAFEKLSIKDELNSDTDKLITEGDQDCDLKEET